MVLSSAVKPLSRIRWRFVAIKVSFYLDQAIKSVKQIEHGVEATPFVKVTSHIYNQHEKENKRSRVSPAFGKQSN